METENGTTSILVYFTGSEKAPIHISGEYGVGLLKMLNITTIQTDPAYGQPNPKIARQIHDVRLRMKEQECLKKQEDSSL